MNLELLEIEFGYDFKFSEEEGNRLRTFDDSDFGIEPVEGKEGLFKLHYSWHKFKMSFEEASSFNTPFTVNSRLGVARIKDIQNFGPKLNVEPNFNEKVMTVTGGNLILMSIRYVKVIVDSCTDRLQDEINNGWVILAICVQPDGRRPDYILGRLTSE